MRVVRKKVEVVLNESLYGKSQLSQGGGFSFYSIRNGNFDQITTRNSEILFAVTKDQFNSWKNLDIVALPITVK